MNRCQCKSGFFALRECEWNAITQCAECRRMICSPHTAKGSDPAHCLDCWARRAQSSGTNVRDRTDTYDDDWAYGYRHQYYSAGYAPRTHHGRHYDADDARSFAAEERELDDGSGDPQAGFGDS